MPHWWEVSALNTAPSLLPLVSFSRQQNILSNGSGNNYRENNRQGASGAVWVFRLIQLVKWFSLVHRLLSAKFKLQCLNAGLWQRPGVRKTSQVYLYISTMRIQIAEKIVCAEALKNSCFSLLLGQNLSGLDNSWHSCHLV